MARETREIRVVPLESHPLNIEDQTALAGSTMTTLGLIPGQNISTQRSLLAAGTLVMWAENLSTARRQQVETVSEQVNEELQKGGLWVPNVEMAKILAVRLNAKGRVVTISPDARALPPLPPLKDGQLRPRTWRRVVDWYGEDRPSGIYKSLAESGTTVVEAGLANYTIGGGMFLCQVYLKLIDPGTGTVLKRSRGYDYHSLARGETLWANDGERFKALFAQIVGKAADEAIRGLGI